MIDFIITLPSFAQDESTKIIWERIKGTFPGTEAVCFYKHPVVTTPTGITPEITFIARSYQPIVIRCLPNQLQEIQEANSETWTINGETFDSPLLELEDFAVVLKS